MDIRRKIILTLSCFVTFSVQGANAQQCDTDSYYTKAYSEITDILEKRNPLSIRRAVFLAEWAFLNGN